MPFRFTRKTSSKPVDSDTRTEVLDLVKDLTKNRPDLRRKLSTGITITASKPGDVCEKYRVTIDGDRETVEQV